MRTLDCAPGSGSVGKRCPARDDTRGASGPRNRQPRRRPGIRRALHPKNEQHRNMRRALRERERMGGVGRERERAMERARARDKRMFVICKNYQRIILIFPLVSTPTKWSGEGSHAKPRRFSQLSRQEVPWCLQSVAGDCGACEAVSSIDSRRREMKKIF